MDVTQQGYVKTAIRPDGIAVLTFYHPNHNSLPSKMLAELTEAFATLGADAAVLAIILQSAEHKTFCAGASFDELSAISDFETGHRFFAGFGHVINAMRKCPKFIVGRIHGKAVGGGVGLAAATDFCVATQFASIRLSELAVGFGPFVIGPAVERKTGLAAFSQLAMTPAEWQTASWAKENGLFQQVFDSTEDMDAYIDQMVKNFSGYSLEAMALLKSVFWENTEHWDQLLSDRAAISGRLALSDFTRNAIAAFKAK